MLKKYPFAILAIALIIGITLQHYFNPNISTIISLVLTSFIGWLILHCLPFKLKFNFRNFKTVFTLVFILNLGSLFYINQNKNHKINEFLNLYSNGDECIGLITKPIEEKTNSFKAEIEIKKIIKSNNDTFDIGQNIFAYLKKDSNINYNFSYGDIVRFIAPLQRIENNGNPGAFNFMQYANFNGFYFQAYINQNQIEKIGYNPSGFKKIIYQCQNFILSSYRKYFKDIQILGLAEAITIGYKNDLDKNLIQDYANSGAIHVIAVSGMHLSYLFLLINGLLNLIKKTKNQHKLKAIIILSIIWLFTFITGAHASIVRAAIMFSALAAAPLFERQYNSVNTLSAAAFFMLCYNPMWLWDVGFQLSFAAVLGISIFYSKINSLFFSKNKIITWLWSSLAVTFSAQIFTLPICLYNFHQIPFQLFFANLFIVPLSSFILIALLAFLPIQFLPIINVYFVNIIEWAIQAMNKIAAYFANWRFLIWDNIYADAISCFLLFSIICCLSGYTIHKRKQFIYCGAAILLAFGGYLTLCNIRHNSQKKIVFYNIPNHNAIDIIAGKSYQCISDTNLLNNNALINLYLKPSRIYFGLKHEKESLPKNASQFEYINQVFILADSFTNFKNYNNSIIYVKGLGKEHIPNNVSSAKYIIAAPTLNYYETEILKNFCTDYNINFHCIKKNGAFVIDE